MTVRTQTASAYFPKGSEMLYRFHSCIDSSLYPHVHDYYEITFVTEGSMDISLNQYSCTIKEGYFILVRPDDVHTKAPHKGACKHLNIAFLPSVFDDIFTFLKSPDIKESILEKPYHAPFRIAYSDKRAFDYEIQRLSMIPAEETQISSRLLRIFIFRILTSYFLEQYSRRPHEKEFMPPWLTQYLQLSNNADVLRQGTDYLYSSVNLSKSYICREFTHYMKMSPTDYINEQRLIYAANLLKHSDWDILDISQEAGFSSHSHFYHRFKAKYQMPPKKFRSADY